MEVHDLLVFLDGNSLALFLIYCLETLLNNKENCASDYIEKFRKESTDYYTGEERYDVT